MKFDKVYLFFRHCIFIISNFDDKTSYFEHVTTLLMKSDKVYLRKVIKCIYIFRHCIFIISNFDDETTLVISEGWGVQLVLWSEYRVSIDGNVIVM